MSLPGRVPGYARDDLKLLPSNCSKKMVYENYVDACKLVDVRACSLVLFRRLWRQLVPFIVVMRPRTDLCWFCQKNVTMISRATNVSDEVKGEAFLKAQDHLATAKTEKEFYHGVCSQAKQDAEGVKQLVKKQPVTFEGLGHYSMDFAQQVHFPSNPLQPGPIYFKTPRKCGIFGVMCEAIPCQVNFLIDESVQCGKGANTVISLLHYFFENYGMGEKHVHLHADNCCGQNKNTYFLWYLMWRCLTGRHVSATLSFLLVGHTKFSPDWAFGLFKRKFRVSEVNCLSDISEVVRTSSKVNVAQLCGNEQGEVFVPIYNFSSFLAKYFKRFDKIRRFHYFKFTASTTVTHKQYSNTEELKSDLAKQTTRHLDVNEMPEVIVPPGLSHERQWYLHDEIREFLPHQYQDVVAPLPTVDKPKK